MNFIRKMKRKMGPKPVGNVLGDGSEGGKAAAAASNK
jgi:hypothetical protein